MAHPSRSPSASRRDYDGDRDEGRSTTRRENYGRDREYDIGYGRRGLSDKRRERYRARDFNRDDDDERRYSLYDDEARRSKRNGDARLYDRESERDRDRGSSNYDKHEPGGSQRARPSSQSPPRRPKRSTSRSRSPQRRSRAVSPSRAGSSARGSTKDKDEEKDKNKGKPNFAPSGLLAAETNTVRYADGTKTVLKYNEPPEARRPTVGWRLYVFKGDEQTDVLHIHRQSAYLIGRDRAVADIFIEHPSCSKQHAVIQYRLVQEKDEFGSTRAAVKPFIIDLESTNGTHVNGEAIPTSRYYELFASDVIKFGQSTREYVLLHDEV